MTLKPASQTRTQTRTTRRRSACYLHPADPAAGICASCLRERLSGLDSLADLEQPSSVSCSGGNGGDGAGGISCRNKGVSRSPEFRRCRSVSATKCEALAGFAEPRRKSCDVRPRNGNTLARLFDVDDECGGSVADSKVETKNILSGAAAIDVGDEDEDANEEGNRDFHGALQISNGIDGDDDDIEDEGEGKTMKEFIDLELQSKNRKLKDFKDIAENFRGAASVFSKKLRKWRQKQKVKKLTYGSDRGSMSSKSVMNSLKGRTLEEIQSEVPEFAMGRRSCDIEPRFSVDGGRLSLDAGRISFEEPRASWDGYMIAKTIPRLAPMLSVVENAMLAGGNGNKFDNHRLSVDGQMHSIMEDETSSGGSGQSNSDSSSSQRRSSFDRSSSVRSFSKKIVGLEGDELKYISNAKLSPAKLVITERELKDWHLKTVKDDQQEKSSSLSKASIVVENKGSNIGSKKSVRWRKMWNVFGFKQKSYEKECESSSSDAMDSVVTDGSEKQQRDFVEEVKDANGWRLMRSGSIVGPRRSVEVIGPNHSRRRSILADGCPNNRGRDQFLLDHNQNVKYASTNLDDDASLPFYLTPLRSSRRRNSICISGNVLQLN
ncbi:hypothetical protein M9H77_05999 [Catharanthus roseus]|uniref:Uncharacterized protein n=1 Tax=Catharanthus roseus TaxID=4058 RepID=A0ACC0BQW3_CATRO|nr:hypothetical protein M9H77_05999 [Catharanthus roseus]